MNDDNKKDIQFNEESKEDKSGFPVYLIIMFVILLVAVFFLPEISSFMKNFKKKKPVVVEVTPIPSPSIPIISEKVITCSKSNVEDGVTVVKTYILVSNEEKLKNVTEELSYSYLKDDSEDGDLTNIDTTCRNLQSTYLMNGVIINCDLNNDDRTFQSLVKVDLELLNSVSDNTDLSEITKYKYNDDVNRIISELENSKYDCSIS